MKNEYLKLLYDNLKNDQYVNIDLNKKITEVDMSIFMDKIEDLDICPMKTTIELHLLIKEVLLTKYKIKSILTIGNIEIKNTNKFLHDSINIKDTKAGIAWLTFENGIILDFSTLYYLYNIYKIQKVDIFSKEYFDCMGKYIPILTELNLDIKYYKNNINNCPTLTDLKNSYYKSIR